MENILQPREGEFTGRTAVISGGASGMGLLSGQCLYQRGANVVLCDCNTDALEQVAATFPDRTRLLTLVCDVRRFEDVAAAVAKTVEHFGGLHILINAAGGSSCRIFNRRADFCDLPIEQLQWGIEVNLMGVLYFCHEAMRQMKAQKQGTVINFGSITGIEGDEGGIDYAISKSVIMNGLNKSMAKMGAPYGIRVNCVAPGPVLTRPAMANMKTALGRAAEPQEIVDMVLYLASDRSSIVTGGMFLMDGGRHLLMNG